METQIDRIKTLIAKNDLQEAFVQIRKVFSESKKQNEVILQESRFNEVKKFFDIGIIDFRETRLTTAQIKFTLLELVDELYKYEKNSADEKIIGKWMRLTEDGDEVYLEIKENGNFSLQAKVDSWIWGQFTSAMYGNAIDGTWKYSFNRLSLKPSDTKGLLSGFPKVRGIILSLVGDQDYTMDEFLKKWNRV